MNSSICIMLTGGTMEAIDTDVAYQKVHGRNSIDEYLKGLKPHFDYCFQRVCEKDSRELTDGDRETILQRIREADTDKILLTHGTFTMTQTAEYLEKNKKLISNKTVVLTGSMTPLEGFWWTDAPFNLGFAVATLLHSKPGVYLAMNGKVFLPGKVKKNLQVLRFESNE